LWQGRIPTGAITVLAGDPGLGKSLLTVSLAARVTRGKIGRGPGNVVLLTAEDSRAHTVVPRLRAAGADLDRVRFGSLCRDGLETSILLPDNTAQLRRLLLEHDARLLVIDPLMAHLSSAVDSWKDQKVRDALRPLQRLAVEGDTAVLVVAHLNKAQGVDPLQRLGGSIGVPAAARSVLLLGRDPDDPDKETGDRRVLAHVKNNLGPLSVSLSLSIEADEESSAAARIVQSGYSSYTGSQLLGSEASTKPSKLIEAIEFLEHQLSDGRRSVIEVEAAAEAAGIKKRTLKRARGELRVSPEKEGLDGGWWLSLPSATGSVSEEQLG
jgi:RecA/RadA recombinase